MGKITQQIVDILSKSNALPTLFVGSGLSRRYLGLPKWDELLKIFADYLDKPYGYYVSEAKLEINGNEDMLLPVVATKIEKDFNQVWFHSQKFEEQREEYDNEIKLGTSALKIAMADYFKKNSSKLSNRYSAEIEKLKKIGNKHISSIITTNYDLFFENCFGSDFFYRTPGNVYVLRDFGVDFFVFYVPDKNTLVHFVTIYSCNAVYSSR